MTLEQAIERRLSDIHGIARSGVSELTGRARREYYISPHEVGRVVGRYGGLNIEELQRAGVSPSQAAEAIERRSGKTFERVVHEVAREMEREGYKPARKRSRGRPVIPPHEARTKKCKLCLVDHSKREHRFHGEGSFHQTHLFAFGDNPMTYSVGVKMVDGSYRIVSSGGSRKAAQRYAKLLLGARVFRGGRIGMTLRPKKNPVTRHRAARITRKLKRRVGRREAMEMLRIAKQRGYVLKKNPFGRGRAFTFHGSFTSLILARRRERATPGSFIYEKSGRYYIIKPKKIRSNPRRRMRKNPNGAKKIYGKVLRIVIKGGRVHRVEAQKTQPHRCDSKCASAGHRYYHNFTSKPVMGIYGSKNHQRLYVE